MDLFSQGFVEILAAEQTPDNPNWYQGTADAVRQAARHFARYDADYYLILAGDHLYRMDYSRARRRAHRSAGRHHHRRAAGVRSTTRRRWASSASIATARSSRSRRSRRASGSTEIGQSIPPARSFARATRRTSRSSRRWASTCSRATCCSRCSAADDGDGFRPRGHSRGARPLPRATRTCSAATGPTSEPSRRSTTRTSC